MLDKDLKRAFVANLRSGRFKQHFGSWFSGDSMCVLSCLWQTAVDLGYTEQASSSNRVTAASDFSNQHLGAEVKNMLMALNDSYRQPFTELALHIENHAKI